MQCSINPKPSAANYYPGAPADAICWQALGARICASSAMGDSDRIDGI